jgi:4-amino-4-deoxy-L-arabinose transferase-like glycosyltransferase
MGKSNSIRNHWPCIIVLGIYFLCILAANPRGEFPLNDDWSYTRSAFSLGSGHGLKVDEWCAPSLVGQALYGSLLSSLTSSSFLALRISTLFLSCCTVLLLWGILLRIRVRKNLACIIILTWVFNPLQFNLSFTYMTEVPFIFFITLGLYLYVSRIESGSLTLLILSAAALGYGFLIRQTAVLFILALIGSLLLDARKDIRKRAQEVILVCCSVGIFIAGYCLWILARGGATAAVHRKFDLLHYLTARQVVGNSYGMLFYLVFILAPVWIYLIASLYRAIRGFPAITRIGIPAVLCAVIISGIWWFHAQYRPADYLPSASYHSRMPFLLNVLYDTGLGPVTLDPDYYSVPPAPVYPRVWHAITALVAAGAVVAGCICIFGLLRLRRRPPGPNRKPVILFVGLSFLLLAIFEIVFSHVQEGGLFDRHILIVSFPFCLLLGILSGESSAEICESRTRLARFIPAGIAIAALGAFCVAGTHDYMEWNRVRWDMGRSLLKGGIDPLTIDGGFEFNAWNNYDTFAARGSIAKVYHWWYDRPDYIISMTPQEGYEVRQTREYFSWVHRYRLNMYILKRTQIFTDDHGF